MQRDTLIDQAEALHEALTVERGRWRGYPVMELRMDRLCTRALARLNRRRCTSVYLEQSDTNLAHWYIRDCISHEVLHIEPSGRPWALEACKDLGYHVEYELWPHRIPANHMNPLLQAQIDAGELVVYYKDERRAHEGPRGAADCTEDRR